MPITVISRKVFSQIANGEDFSTNTGDYSQNLIGSVMERVVVETELLLFIISNASTAIPFEVDGTAKTISRSSGSFITDGWHIGDEFEFSDGITFTGTIISITDTVITYTLDAGTDTDGTYNDAVIVIQNDDYLAALVQFGLPENSDTTDNFINVVDGSDQAFTLDGLNSSFQVMNPMPGARSWITGDCKIKKGVLTAGQCLYTVRQEFIILPYYLQEIESNLTDGNLPEDFFKGSLSIKYIIGLQLRRLLSDPNIQHDFSDTNELGSVGWFGENYNGFPNNYEVELISYQDNASSEQVDGIQIDKTTKINAKITNAAGLFNAGTKVGGYVSAILDPSQYEANPVSFKDLWLYDNIVRTNDGNVTGLTGVIKSFQTSRTNANEIAITMTVSFTTQQQASLSEGQKFIIAFQTADSSKARDVSDMVIMVCDVAELIKDSDISGLLVSQDLRFIPHTLSDEDNGNTNVRGFDQDGVMIKYAFGLDISKRARIDRLTYKLIARNNVGQEFDIDAFDFDLSSSLLVPEGAYQKQNFNLDTTRGFQLPAGDFMNRVRLGYYNSLSPLRHGELLSVSPTTELILTPPYPSILYSPMIQDMKNAALNTGGAIKLVDMVQVPTGVDGRPVPWLTFLNGGAVNGMRFIEEIELTAGENTINYSTLGTIDVVVIPFDVQKKGMKFAGMNASVTLNSFKVIAPNGGKFSAVIVKKTGLTNVRAGILNAVAGPAGSDFNFDNLGIDIYTAFIFDTEYNGNIVDRTKFNDKLNVRVNLDTQLNILILL